MGLETGNRLRGEVGWSGQVGAQAAEMGFSGVSKTAGRFRGSMHNGGWLLKWARPVARPDER